MAKLSNIEKSILETVSYFDIFSFPLTQIELYKNLYLLNNDISFNDFINVLETNEIINMEIDNKEGFYFLHGRDSIVQIRKQRYDIAYKKYILAMRYIRKLLYFPCFKSIMVCNTLALENSNENSDIDLFIITERNRIWTARFIAVMVSKILNLRPKKNNQKNKICLSFYIDEKHLNIENVSKNHNIYFIYWISQLVPIYDQDDIFNQFYNENSWIRMYLKNIFNFNTADKRRLYLNKNGAFFRRIFSYLFTNGVENILKEIQMKKMNLEIKNKLNLNDDVLINDGIIKLHTNDRREQYKNEFELKIKKYYEKYI